MKNTKSCVAPAALATAMAFSLLLPSDSIAAPRTGLLSAGRANTTVVNTILSGAGTPTKTIGIDGDFYIDTKNANLYGPKIKGVWKIATSLRQAASKSESAITGGAGAKGDTGSQGDKGDKGDKGATGDKGVAGEKGTTGDKGAAGLVGSTGATGSTGIAGAPGIAGAKGDIGLTGNAGLAGTTGAKGEPGTAGINGSNGLNGNDGAAGVKGDTGLTGTTGLTGLTGLKGDTGTAGAKGDTGVAGSAGISVAKFVTVPNITVAIATEGFSASNIFFTADVSGNYTFEVMLTGVATYGDSFKLTAEIVNVNTPIPSQFVVASDAQANTNSLSGRQYGLRVMGVAANVPAGTIFSLRISNQSAVGGGTPIVFVGRALINKVGSIG